MQTDVKHGVIVLYSDENPEKYVADSVFALNDDLTHSLTIFASNVRFLGVPYHKGPDDVLVTPNEGTCPLVEYLARNVHVRLVYVQQLGP